MGCLCFHHTLMLHLSLSIWLCWKQGYNNSLCRHQERQKRQGVLLLILDILEDILVQLQSSSVNAGRIKKTWKYVCQKMWSWGRNIQGKVKTNPTPVKNCRYFGGRRDLGLLGILSMLEQKAIIVLFFLMTNAFVPEICWFRSFLR